MLSERRRDMRRLPNEPSLLNRRKKMIMEMAKMELDWTRAEDTSLTKLLREREEIEEDNERLNQLLAAAQSRLNDIEGKEEKEHVDSHSVVSDEELEHDSDDTGKPDGLQLELNRVEWGLFSN